MEYRSCKNIGCPFCGCMGDNTCKLPNVAESAPWLVSEYGESLRCQYGKAFVMDFKMKLGRE